MKSRENPTLRKTNEMTHILLNFLNYKCLDLCIYLSMSKFIIINYFITGTIYLHRSSKNIYLYRVLLNFETGLARN